MLYLAPLQGYTEVEFRRAYAMVFSGLNGAVSPFIPLASGARFRLKHLHDVIPAENKSMKVVPQVLGIEPEKFIALAHRLHELGYDEVNWNLGCPKRTVAAKKRGCGILPYPDVLRVILEKIIPELPLKLSIKTRLGHHSPEEFYQLVNVYNDFPLHSLIVHPRTGIQQYEGDMFLNILDETIAEIKHPVVFSGDIKDRTSFLHLSERYPQINNWMIGRGLLTNPALPEIILGKFEAADPEVLRSRQLYFHQELYCEIKAKFQRSQATLNKMKDYWSYFSRWFADSEALFLRLAHLDNLDIFMDAARRILNEQELAAIEGRSNRQVKIGNGS